MMFKKIIYACVQTFDCYYIWLCLYLLATKGVVCSDHLAHKHGGGHHYCATCHWSCHKLRHQLLPCWESVEKYIKFIKTLLKGAKLKIRKI